MTNQFGGSRLDCCPRIDCGTAQGSIEGFCCCFCVWQQVGQAVRLNWWTLADKFVEGGRHRAVPHPASVAGQPIPAASYLSQLPADKNTDTRTGFVSWCVLFLIKSSSTFNVRVSSAGGGRGLVFSHKISMDEAVKSNCFSTTPGVKNSLVKWATALFSD